MDASGVSGMKNRIITFGSMMLLALYSLSGWSDETVPHTEQLIEQKVEKKWQEYVNSEAFESRVEEVILQFIDKQNKARADRQRAASEAIVQNVAPVDSKQDYIRGQLEAEFSLIEYSDYECPFCKRFHRTAAQLVERNSDVNWVYRHFPLSFHNPGAQKESEAAECAGAVGGNEMFWAYTDKIYQRTKSNGKGFPIKDLVPLAVELGLDEAQFKTCFDSEQFKKKVLQQFANGQRSGVTGTPGNFLRHNPTGATIAVHGSQPLATLEQALKQLKESL